MLIVGVGSAGGVLLQRLARAGFQSGRIRSRPILGHGTRLGESTRPARIKLYWKICESPAAKIHSRSAPTIAAKASAAAPSTGRLFTPRFHPSDFQVYPQDGVGSGLAHQLRGPEALLQLLELEMPVAGPAYYPWGDPHGHPYGPHPMGGVGNVLIEAARSLVFGSARAARWRFFRLHGRPPALHLSWLLHSGLQGRRQG